MAFSLKKMKERLNLNTFIQNIDEIEEYLGKKSTQINSVLEQRKSENHELPKSKADSEWMFKTATANLRRSARKMSKHL